MHNPFQSKYISEAACIEVVMLVQENWEKTHLYTFTHPTNYKHIHTHTQSQTRTHTQIGIKHTT